jgi:arsenate reductase
MNPTLSQTIQQVSLIQLTEERKSILQPLVDYLYDKIDSNDEIRLTFICTHNSRRSHLAQVWAQTMAYHFGINTIQCYSGGTEVTALFPKIVQTLLLQGFQIETLSTSNNPVYAIKYDDNALPIIGFSKTYDDTFNPKAQFAAIMTCSSADEGCPIVVGAEKRFPIRYEDPKVFDGTAQMDAIYVERSIEIASELFYVFSKIRS